MKESPYDPLGHCPPTLRPKYERRAAEAHLGHLKAIVDLACNHCMGWQSHLPKSCSDPSCPLWIRATKIK